MLHGAGQHADDARCGARRGFAGRAITFGVSEPADVRAVSVDDRGLSGVRARVTTPAGEVVLESPLLGRGNLSNLLAATAVAIDAGVALDDIAAAAPHLRPAARRGAVLRLPNGVTVVDDSYNSSPAALATALGVIKSESGATRKIAVLGEMLELGDHSTRLHAESGRLAAHSGVSQLYAIGGPAARALAAAATEQGAAAVVACLTERRGSASHAGGVKLGILVLAGLARYPPE